MARDKNLTIGAIKKEDAKNYGTKRKVYVGEYTLTMDKTLKPTKVTNMVKEMIRQVDYCRAKGIKIMELDFTAYGMLLMIKHFTSLGASISDTFEGQLNALEALIDNGIEVDGVYTSYLEAIVEEFDPNEVQKIAKLVKSLDETTEAFESELKKLDLKNKDVLLENQ